MPYAIIDLKGTIKMETVTRRTREFNENVQLAVERTIVEVLGAEALESIVKILQEEYDVSRDELPYRSETLYRVLEEKYEVFGAKTLGTVIARKLYASLGLEFETHDGYSLTDYIELAKSRLHLTP